MGNWLYLVGLVLVIAGFLIGRIRAGNSVRARDVSGNMVTGNVSGSVSQNAQLAAAEAGKPQVAARASKPDRVAWLIMIIGVLIAVAQLAYSVIHDMLTAAK